MKAAKRFYELSEIARLENGFGVHLDGRQLKTPGKKPLIVETEFVAGLIAAEWDAQVDLIKPETMPVTRLVNVSIELTPGNRDRLALEARNYAETDLLCYRAESPLELRLRQAELWDPILDWASKRGISLTTTHSVLAIPQNDATLDRVEEFAKGLGDLDLTLFIHLVAVYGSAILSLAVMERHLDGSQGFELSRLDNLYQIEQWGEDEEAAEISANLEAEIVALCKILET